MESALYFAKFKGGVSLAVANLSSDFMREKNLEATVEEVWPAQEPRRQSPPSQPPRFALRPAPWDCSPTPSPLPLDFRQADHECADMRSMLLEKSRVEAALVQETLGTRVNEDVLKGRLEEEVWACQRATCQRHRRTRNGR